MTSTNDVILVKIMLFALQFCFCGTVQHIGQLYQFPSKTWQNLLHMMIFLSSRMSYDRPWCRSIWCRQYALRSMLELMSVYGIHGYCIPGGLIMASRGTLFLVHKVYLMNLPFFKAEQQYLLSNGEAVFQVGTSNRDSTKFTMLLYSRGDTRTSSL